MNKFNISAAVRKRGISLIEGVLYLVIALAVIVGGIVFFQQAQLSNQVTDTARASVAISSQTRGLYQSQRTFGTAPLSTALTKSGAVPSNFQGLDSIVHPFGGTMSVDGNDSGFAITLSDLSEAACSRLATVGEGGEGPLGTGINGLIISADASGVTFDGVLSDETDYDAAPVSAADASSACAPGVDVVVDYAR